MKKVLIISPIVNYGGREVELNLIAKALMKFYQVSIFSTGAATNQSIALNGLKKVCFKSINQQVLRQNIFLKFITYLSYIKNGRSKPLRLHLSNNFSNKFFNLRKYEVKALEKAIRKMDLVWVVADFDSPLLIETIELCKKRRIPCVLRTTRTIFEMPHPFLKKIINVTKFVHHSENNAQKLFSQVEHQYTVIDQCALSEESLLSLEIKTSSTLNYGFLGRFSKGKQILPLVDFFKNRTEKFYIAGDGFLKNEIIDCVKKRDNLEFMGYFNNSNISNFFNEIDVLIISSMEESGPLVGIEAMAAGKIVISTKVGAMEDRFKKTNAEFWLKKDLSNLNDLIFEIESLSVDRINQIKKHNRLVYNKNYSIKNIKRKYAKVTDSILENF